MASEVTTTVILLIPNQNEGYDAQEFEGVVVNKQAPIRMILQGIVSGLRGIGIEISSEQVDILVQATEGSTLSSLDIQNGSRIVLLPKFVGPAVRFPHRR